MAIHIIYDLDAFSHSIKDGRSPLADPAFFDVAVLAYASFAFLEELAPLRRAEPDLYRAIRKYYISATCPRLILPGNEIARRESVAGRPLSRRECLLGEDDYFGAINLLLDDDLDILSDEVRDRKNRYAADMAESLARLLEDPSVKEMGNSERKDTFAGVFSDRESSLQSRAESIYGRTDIDYGTLPHVRFFLDYFEAKKYQAHVSNRKFRRGELYDVSYLVEAVTLGNLVTDDKDLRDTAGLIVDGGEIRVFDLRRFLESHRKT